MLLPQGRQVTPLNANLASVTLLAPSRERESQAVVTARVNVAAGTMWLDTTVTSARTHIGTLTVGPAVIHVTVIQLGRLVPHVMFRQEDATAGLVSLAKGVTFACPTTLDFPWKDVRLVSVILRAQQIISVMN